MPSKDIEKILAIQKRVNRLVDYYLETDSKCDIDLNTFIDDVTRIMNIESIIR